MSFKYNRSDYIADHKTFSKRVKKFRKKRGYTQKDLAKRMGDIDQSFVCKLENYYRYIGTDENHYNSITIDTAFRVAAALDVPVYKLFKPFKSKEEKLEKMLKKKTKVAKNETGGGK